MHSGSFTVGYQVSEEDTGISGTGSTYENTAYSITFQVNDNLSVGYNHVESNQSSGAADAETVPDETTRTKETARAGSAQPVAELVNDIVDAGDRVVLNEPSRSSGTV